MSADRSFLTISPDKGHRTSGWGIKTIANWPTEAELLKQARANAARLHRLAQPSLLSEHAAFFEQPISVPGLEDTMATSPAAEDNRPMRSTEPKPPGTS